MRAKIIKLIELYKEGFTILKDIIKSKLIKTLGKYHIIVQPKKLQITRIPPSEREKILTLKILEILKENEKLKKQIDELQAALDEKRRKKFAELIKKAAEAEKANEPVSMAELLKRLRLKGGIALFRKPIKVYSFDMRYVGDLYDWEIIGNGWRFVIRTPDKQFRKTPVYTSIWDCWIRPDTIHHQLKGGFMHINLVVTKDGHWMKLGPEFLNMYYEGVPVEQIVAYFKERLDEAYERLQTYKLVAEVASTKNKVLSVDHAVSEELNKLTSAVFENAIQTLRKGLLPTAFAAINQLDTAHMEVHRARKIAEAALSEVDRLTGRLQTLQESAAPERIIITQDEMIRRLEEINKQLTQIINALSGSAGKAKEMKAEETGEKKTE